MINTITLFFGFFLTYKIFFHGANYKSLLWVIIPAIFVNGYVVITDIPLKMTIMRWLLYSIFFTVISLQSKLLRNWNSFPLKYTISLLIIGSIIIGFFDPRFSLFERSYYSFRDILETYFPLFIGYVAINKEKDVLELKKPLYYTIIIITFYGLFNLVTQTNPYYMFVIDTFYEGGAIAMHSKMRMLDTTRDRFYTLSTFNLPFNYGYVSSLLSIFFLDATHYKKYKRLGIFGFIAGLIGAVICGSRTVLFAEFFALAVYVLYVFKIKKLLKIIILSTILLVTAYSTIPMFQEKIDATLDVLITGGEKTRGSSVEMRRTQLLASFKYFSQSPIRGNGYDYIAEDLGWGDRDNKRIDKDLHGFESIIYKLLIEQGIIGLFTKFLLFISLIFYFLKKSHYYDLRNLIGLGLAITMLFITFTIATGPLDSWPLTMLFLGIILKLIKLREANIISISMTSLNKQ